MSKFVFEPSIIERIRAEYRRGVSLKKIGEDMNIGRDVVRRVLSQAGEPIRGPEAANRLMMTQRTPQENKRNTLAANAAARVRKQTIEEKILRARTVERKQLNVSAAEMYLAELLGKRGYETTTQKAIGPYNCDIACRSVAIEIYGGGWHAAGRHAARSDERFEYLLTHGWNVIVVWVDRRSYPLRNNVVDPITRFIDETPTPSQTRGRYVVLRGDGRLAYSGSTDLSLLRQKPPKAS